MSDIFRPDDGGTMGGGGECEFEFDLPLMPPNPTSTCICSESVLGERAPGLEGERGSGRVSIFGRAVELPAVGAAEGLKGAGVDEDDTTALGGGGNLSRRRSKPDEDGLRSCIRTSVLWPRSSGERVGCWWNGIGDCLDNC